MPSIVHIRSRYFLLIALLAIATLSLSVPIKASSQSNQELMTSSLQIVRGTVKDSDGRAVEGATVRINELNKVVTTHADGSFHIERVPTGSYTLIVSSVGQEDFTTQITVNATSQIDLTVSMTESVTDAGEITVIGSSEDRQRLVQSLRDIPGSVALVGSREIRQTRAANLNDVVRFVPGVWVQPRFGAADESQLSVRGSGLRNNFHLRGINLLINGMPYRNTDGFSDFEALEMLATDNIQVYKGGNALRYGGSTLGGAINFETKTGHTSTPLMFSANGGSFGYYKAQVATGDVFGKSNYYVSYVKTQLDGYRQYSMQQRDRINLSLGHAFSEHMNARLFYLFARVEEDLPGSLTSAQFHADPSQAVANNITNRWGRDFDLHHVGIQLRNQLSQGIRLEITPYLQYRDIVHPIFRVLDQVNRDYGVESRLESAFKIAGQQHRLNLGGQLAAGRNNNEQYNNSGGFATSLQKKQKESARLFALYAEDIWGISRDFSVVAGVRFDRSTRKNEDQFLTDGDQSGERVYEFVMPKLGLLYDLDEIHGQVYANFSRSVEPPLLSELNSFTQPGLVNIDAQDAWQYEIGTRGQSGAIGWDASAFLIDLKNEIININVQPFPNAPFTVPSYRNARTTRHTGVELGLVLESDALRQKSTSSFGAGTRLAYTYSTCKYVNDATYGNNELPGLPDHALQAEVTVHSPFGMTLRPSIEWIPQDYMVNSANTEHNHGWTVINARAEQTINALGGSLYLEVRNLTNEVYSPAVNVDASNGAFYQPGDKRSVYFGFSVNR